MRALTLAVLLGFSLGLPLVAPPAGAAAAARDPWDGRLMPPEKVAPNVWVMRQPDRLWAAVIGNVTIIEQSDGVVLVDSGGSIADGRDVVEGVRGLTDKPVKAVAITHWHNDHPLGLPGIVEAYPKARVMSSARTRRDVQTETNTSVGKPDPERDAARRERVARLLAELRAEIDDPKTPVDVRSGLELESKWIAKRLERLEGNYVVVPTDIVTDTLVIDDPEVPVELKVLGTGNTHGDLIAWLPRLKVVATGDMVVLPTPYGFTVSTKPWLETLARLEQLPFETLVPGHGRVQRDRAYLDTLKWSMRDIAEKAAAAAAVNATTKEQAIAAFDRKPHEARFGAADGWTRKWLNDYWLEGMFGTAFDEARGIPAPGK